jgi:acetolactate synthase-1/2/3 large subunit
MSRTVADELADGLRAAGVRFAFGMPGGDVLPLLDAFARHDIDFILTRHEASAGFMAAAVWEITGRPAACVGTLGPGATNLVTGVAGAWLDRCAMVAITGHANPDLGPDYTHQILDHASIFRPIVKRGDRLQEGRASEQIAGELAALRAAPPGPVYIDVCAQVASSIAHGAPVAPPEESAGPAIDLAPALACLERSRRPVVVVGLGAIRGGASDGVRALVRALDAPVLSTYKALGVADPDHPLFAGPFGLSPSVDRWQQRLLDDADLIVAIGLDPVELRPEWTAAWPASTPILALDGPGAAGPWGRVVARVLAPIPTSVAALMQRVAARDSEWSPSALAAHRALWQEPFDDGPDGPAAATRAAQRGAPAGTRLCLDVGSHRITASHAWVPREPIGQLQSNGLCSMATGLPYGLASRIVDPDRPCVVITGDMGLLMCAGELGVVAERGLDLVVVVFVDDALSLIELKQERVGLGGGGVRFLNPDPVLLARAFGGAGVRVRGEQAVERAVRDAIAAGGLRVVAVDIDAGAYRRQM